MGYLSDFELNFIAILAYLLAYHEYDPFKVDKNQGKKDFFDEAIRFLFFGNSHFFILQNELQIFKTRCYIK